MTADTFEEHPCDVLRRPDGRPVLTLPPHWSGLPIGLHNIPGAAEHGAFETPCPTLLVAQRGEGERWYRSAGRSHHLATAPGMIELYPRALEFDRMTWAGRAGHCIAIHLLPQAMRSLTHLEHDLVREHEVFDQRVQWLAGELLDAARAASTDALYIEGLSLALLGRLEQRGSLTRVQARRNGRFSPALQQRLRTLIAESLGSDLSIARLSSEAHMSPDHFAHCFKASFGDTPHRFVQRQRVSAALQLLRRTQLSIAQVALSVGFASQSHFTQVFRQHIGATPASWRRG